MKYIVEIKETLSRVVEVEAESSVKALGEYRRDDISLTDEAYEIIESKFADFMCQL